MSDRRFLPCVFVLALSAFLFGCPGKQVITETPTVEGAEDVRILAPPDVSLLEVRPKLLEASRLDMSAHDVLELVVALRVGVEVGATWDGPVRIPIRLALAHETDAFTLAEVPVTTPAEGA